MLTKSGIEARPWTGRNQHTKTTLLERFMEKTSRAPSGCLLWTGAVNRNGYGSIGIGGRVVTASRAAYQLFVGEIGPGLLVCHTCDVPLCVEPSHLFLGTNAANRADCVLKGRASGARGERNGKSKLTPEDVATIRTSPMAVWLLAMMYKVNPTSIHSIKSGRGWRHV